MSTVPDPTSIRWPGMIDDQAKYTVFLKPLVTSAKIEVGEFTYYNACNDGTIRRSSRPGTCSTQPVPRSW